MIFNFILEGGYLHTFVKNIRRELIYEIRYSFYLQFFYPPFILLNVLIKEKISKVAI